MSRKRGREMLNNQVFLFPSTFGGEKTPAFEPRRRQQPMPEWERRFRDLYQTLREQINAAIDDDNTRLMPADLVVLKNSPARQMVEAAFSEHGDTPEVLAMRVAVKIGNHGEVYKQADKLLEKSSRPDLAETKKTA